MDRPRPPLTNVGEEMKKQIITMVTSIILTLSSAWSASYKVNQGEVEFTAKGFPTFITISGKSQNVSGELGLVGKKAQGKFKLPLNTLKTGMDLRDEHMTQKYLEVGKFPEATLTLNEFDLRDSGEVQGLLKLHNVEKPIRITYESELTETGIIIKTEFSLQLSDYGIDIPSFQGITVAKEIKLRVAFSTGGPDGN